MTRASCSPVTNENGKQAPGHRSTGTVVTMHDPPSEAPGSLEQVRTLLNSWRVPHDTREPTDDLPGWLADPAEWGARLPHLPRPGPDEVAEVLALRDALRAALGQAAPEGVDGWLTAHPVVVRVDP